MKISSACPICRQVGFVVVKPNGICDTPQGRYDIWIHPMPQRIGRTYSVCYLADSSGSQRAKLLFSASLHTAK